MTQANASVLAPLCLLTAVACGAPDGELARGTVLDEARYRQLVDGESCDDEVFPDRSRVGCVDEPGGAARVVLESGFSHIGTGLVRSLQRFVWIRPDLSGSDTLGLYGGIETYGFELRGGVSVGYMTHPFYSRTMVATSTSPPRFFAAINPGYSIE